MAHTTKFDDLKIEQSDPGPTYMIRTVLITFTLTLLLWYGVARYAEPTLTCESTETKKLVSETVLKDGTVECRYVREYKMTKLEMQK